MLRLPLVVLFAVPVFLWSCKRTPEPMPVGPVPTENQLQWQEMEYYAFVHFSLNTYTDQSWGYGNEDVNLFNPEKLDCRQWARICKEAGMKGIIITAKHHCGFCLWPSEYTGYSVKNAPWKDGKGDVVREMADACREYGLKMGIYISPWDRNHPDYGKPEYITYFRNQIKELLTGYGDIFEIWFDGANGGTGYYGGANENRLIDRTTYYDWQPTYRMIRELQPGIVIWNDGGDRADLRWVGTEEGYVGETNWSLLNGQGEVDWGMLHFGLEDGDSWVPAEVNTSVRPEWFYHPGEDSKVKTVPFLMETYYNSIGRNGCLLLNFPITPDGLIHENDEQAALGFARAIKESFAVNLVEKARARATDTRGNARRYAAGKAIDRDKNSYWATNDSVTKASLTIDFGTPTLFNRFLVQEYIRSGQRVKAFTVDALIDGTWKEVAKATTIGYKRILRFPGVSATAVRLNITDSKSCLLISNIGIYNAPAFLNAPVITRKQSGEINIFSDEIGPYFYYTLDGSEPTPQSSRFTEALKSDGKIVVKAIAVDPATGKCSPVCTETFDICRKDWKITGTDDENAGKILDGDPASSWCLANKETNPAELVIDLGTEHTLCGFKYLPDQSRWPCAFITYYRFYISGDKKTWKLVSEGEFSNIRNNPLMQTRIFPAEKARYFKLTTVDNTEGKNNRAGFAEIDIITE
ncbi:MAG: alpha-L-fucosidase [Bacteroidota bacterium]